MNHVFIGAVLTLCVATGLGLTALAQTPLAQSALAQSPAQKTVPTPKNSFLPATDIIYSGPLVITRGGTYHGNWQSLDPRVPAVTIRTREPVVIENANVRGRGTLIGGFNVDLTVRNTHGYGLNPLTDRAFPGRFIAVEFIYNLRAENNYLQGTSGIYVNTVQPNVAPGQTIKILRNRVQNVDGRYVDQAGRITGQRYLVQAVQLNHVLNVPDIEIAWNEVINQPGQSAAEENINLYETSGTPTSPIRIHNNYIHGAYAVDPLKDKEYSGGGIMLGDGSQKDLSVTGGHTEVYRNQIINTSNQGIAIAGGHDQHVYQNRILSSGKLPGGEIIPTANVGIYMWDMSGGAQRTPATFYNNSVRDNLIGWTRFDAAGKAYANNLWLPSCTPAARSVCGGNRAWPGSVTPLIERTELVRWQQKLLAAKITVGPPTSAVAAK
ncbi:hypothetical protein [Deinococcus arenicola]|uniref:Right handed beta helix domain-containing protein n=1 Tax=Deinococcus arenicola TaxID=2994950 RepID=A0ABU4DNT8_9DEIO|nr:hypothetical protein [Deinococcus sp. ZS9-10]MDV6373627.1 hypothetical protein [Deinococcus sp. ZS9-10]